MLLRVTSHCASRSRFLIPLRYAAAVAMAIVASSTAAGAQTNFQVLHDFTAAEGIPSSPLVQATDGNLYGTTRTGGTFNKGTVFEIGRAHV